MRRRHWAAAGVLAVSTLLVTPWFVRAVLAARSDNSIRRGARLAEREGCFGCHRAPLRQDVSNPGSRFGSIPGFDGGELMMYAKGREDVRAWIAEGGPRGHWEDSENRAARERQPIRMPAFAEHLSAAEIEDLVDYMIATNAWLSPPDEAGQRGEEIARTHCLGCHGPGGAGGLSNRRSVSEYVPALWGPDAADLARDEAEFRQWVRDGKVDRLDRFAPVRWFWRRQTLRMPAYRDSLSTEDVGALRSYVLWLESTAGGTRQATGSDGDAAPGARGAGEGG